MGKIIRVVISGYDGLIHITREGQPPRKYDPSSSYRLFKVLDSMIDAGLAYERQTEIIGCQAIVFDIVKPH